MAVKPKLAMIPSGVGTDTLYSVLPSDGTGDFTFDRNLNTATRINKDGLIEMVDADVPRLNYPLIDGVVSGCPSLLLEPQRTNLVAYSEEFDNAAWIKVTNTSVSDNSAISPDGTQNSSEVKAIATSTSVLGFYTGFTVSSGVKYTVSFFAKKGDAKYIQVYHAANQVAGLPRTNFDLENGLVSVSDAGHTSSIEDYGNGWYRCIVELKTEITILQTFFNAIKEPNAARDAQSNWSANDNFYFWGAQLEQGSYPTSYIPSLIGSVTTRSAETCNNSGDANTFNDSEGVLMAEISLIEGDDANKQLSITNSTTSEAIKFTFLDADRLIFERKTSSGDTQDTVDFVNGFFTKIALQYKANGYKAFFNGFEVTLTQSSNLPTGLNRLAYDNGIGGADFYGNTKQIQYFDTALTDTDLEELTSWTSFNEMAESQLYSIQ